MGVYAHLTGEFLFRDCRDLSHLAWQRATVGVAQNHKIRTGLFGRLPRGQRVLRIILVAIQRMLGIVNHLALVLFEKRNRVGDHCDVFLRRGSQHFLHMQQPRFAKNGDHRRLRIDQQFHLRVVLGIDLFTAGRAEGCNLYILPLAFGRFLEELDVLGIAPRPTALHVVHTKGIQFFGHAQLVCDRKTDSFALRSIAQGRVIYFHQILHQGTVFPPRPVISKALGQATPAPKKSAWPSATVHPQISTAAAPRKVPATRSWRDSTNVPPR